MDMSPQLHSDYLNSEFGYWGSSTLTEKMDPKSPYVSFMDNTFPSKSPIFIQTGRAEILFDDDTELAHQFKDNGTKTQLFVSRNAPHDIILVGPVIGFVVEAVQAAKEAGDFLRANRLE